MDLDGFARREYAAGRMAVVFYRKHPQIDAQLQVRWIGDWTRAVEELSARPELEARLRALDEQTDAFLRSLARTLDELGNLQHHLGVDVLHATSATRARPPLLDVVFAVVFDVARTRGKVDEWYADVQDPRKAELAKMLIGCARRLEFLSSTPEETQRLRGTIGWLERDVIGGLASRLAALESHLGTVGHLPPAIDADAIGARLSAIEHQLNGGRPRAASRRAVIGWLRRADLSIQYRLRRHARGLLLPQYHAVRGRLKRWLPKPASRP
jgi:hypothetical protein